jgi:hypothetical protein
MVETVEADMAASRRGDGLVLPNNHFEVNERTYAWEAGETFYPVSGPGFIIVDRPTLKAIQTFSRHGGVNERSLTELGYDKYMPTECVELAKDIWRLRTNRADDDLLD